MKKLNLICSITLFSVSIIGANAQSLFHSYYSGIFSHNFSKQAIAVDKSEILDVGFTSQDTLEKWVSGINQTRPFITRTDYNGDLSLGTCVDPFQYSYDLFLPGSVLPEDADIKSVFQGVNKNYYIVGNFFQHNSNRIYIAEVDYRCGSIVNIVDINTSFVEVVPTKIIEYKGKLYCIGYHKLPTGSDYDMFILESANNLTGISINTYQNTAPSGVTYDENCYPFDIIPRFNPTTSTDELTIVGEINNVDPFMGSFYDHPYAFFSTFDINTMAAASFTCYPWNLVLGTEGTYARCFAEFGTGYILPVMIDNTIMTKTISLLELDYYGNLVSHFEVDNIANLAFNSKMLPTSVHVERDNLKVTSMEFPDAYGSATNNTLFNNRLVNVLDIDYNGLASTLNNYTHIVGPRQRNIYSYSTILDPSTDLLYVRGTYWDNNSNYRTFQTNVEWNDGCFTIDYPYTFPSQDVIQLSIPSPYKYNHYFTVGSVTHSKNKLRNARKLCETSGFNKQTGFEDLYQKDLESAIERIVVVDLLGRIVLDINNSDNQLSGENVQDFLTKHLSSNEVFIVNLYDSKNLKMRSFKYCFLDK